MSFRDLKAGSRVWRILGGMPMLMEVTEVAEDGTLVCGAVEDGRIFRGDWTFDPETGAEVDEYLKWGPPPLMTGSYLSRRKPS